MAASGRGIFLYMYIVKTCEHRRRHIFGLIFMKFAQNICFLDTRVGFKNGSGHLNNMAAGMGAVLSYMPPPFEEEGVYCFVHVSPSTRWFPDDNSRALMPRIMKLHRYIDHDSQMTPIDFQVTRSKVKVTVTKNSKMVSG